MFPSLQQNMCDCLEPVCSVVFLRTLSLPSEGLSYMYTCGCLCLDIIPDSFVLVVSFSVKLSFEEIQTLLCIWYSFIVKYLLYSTNRGSAKK
jgi:hypothetical protein